MTIRSTTVSFTVEDVEASLDFFVTHLSYEQQMSADGFASLRNKGGGVDITLLRKGIDVLPEAQRHRTASGVILAFVVDDVHSELARLTAEDVPVTLPLREEEWGERLFQVQDPNGIVIEFVQWIEGAGPDSWTTEE